MIDLLELASACVAHLEGAISGESGSKLLMSVLLKCANRALRSNHDAKFANRRNLDSVNFDSAPRLEPGTRSDSSRGLCNQSRVNANT